MPPSVTNFTKKNDYCCMFYDRSKCIYLLENVRKALHQTKCRSFSPSGKKTSAFLSERNYILRSLKLVIAISFVSVLSFLYFLSVTDISFFFLFIIRIFFFLLFVSYGIDLNRQVFLLLFFSFCGSSWRLQLIGTDVFCLRYVPYSHSVRRLEK